MSEASAGPAIRQEPKVFICYRREDTAAHAGRLYDAMVARFGERNVFMDVDLAPGVDFVERITKVVSDCLVLIVVMGRNWATAKDEGGGARIADPTDFVRLEVETGLSRPDVTPIPVLVSGAQMPKREDLPPELQAITRRNALELSDARWGYDVGCLNSTLDELLADTARPGTSVATPPPAPGPPAWRLLLEGVLVAGVTALAARKLGNEIPGPDHPHEHQGGAIASVILRRAETWALVGAALAVWLAIRTRRTDLFRLGMSGLLIGAIAGAIAGAIFAVPVYLNEPVLLTDPSGGNPELAEWIDLGSLAVTGGFLGALIGALWLPPRLGAGLAGGIAAGALLQLVFIGAGKPGTVLIFSGIVLPFGLGAIAIAGLTLATLLALDRGRSEAKAPGRLPLDQRR
jgi:TIR domain